MQQLSWKNFPVKIEKSLCKLFGPKYAPNPVHNSVTIYSVKVLSGFLCVKGASPPRRRRCTWPPPCGRPAAPARYSPSVTSPSPAPMWDPECWPCTFTVRPGDKLTIIFVMVTPNSRAFSEAVGGFLWEKQGSHTPPKAALRAALGGAPPGAGYICERSVKITLRNRQFS